MNCEWQNSECDTESKTQQKATEIAQRFIDHFVDLTLPGEACSQNTKRCPHCNKAYKTVKGLTNHLEMVHPDMQLHIADRSEDGVHNYSVNYCTLSLLRLSLKDAKRRADGD